MKASDITLAIVITLIFVSLFLYNLLVANSKNISNNWAEYRCNPSIMPFADFFGHDSGENFTFCIQDIQTDYMSYLLQPVNYLMNVLNKSVNGLGESIQNIRKVINYVRTSIASVFQSIFGVFLNILIQFQHMVIKIKDLIGKLIGIMTTMIFLLQGSILGMQSAWNGPPGNMVKIMNEIKL